LLSRSTVSRLTEALWEKYEAFSERDLSGYEVVYLFADAVYESLHRQAGLKEAVLVKHFRDLVRRGLGEPLTITTDGAPGLIAALEAIWPKEERVRCWMHKMRNVLDKVPQDARSQLKPYLKAVLDAPDHRTGEQLARLVVERFGSQYPSAIRSFADDLPASLAHLKLPPAHRQSVRTTNLVERSFVEERRRAKVIPRFRSERECLKLVLAVLWRASERWRRVRFSEHKKRQLDRYRRQRAQSCTRGSTREVDPTVARIRPLIQTVWDLTVHRR